MGVSAYFEIVTYRLSIVAVVLGVFAWGAIAYYAINMWLDVQDEAKPKYRGGRGFPLFVDEQDFFSDEGRRCYRLYHRWLFIFAAACAGGALVMYIHHKYWP